MLVEDLPIRAHKILEDSALDVWPYNCAVLTFTGLADEKAVHCALHQP